MVRAFRRCRLSARQSRLCLIAGPAGDGGEGLASGCGAAAPRRRSCAAHRDLPLAVLTERGLGTAPDLPQAMQLYRNAAERGQSSAQVKWGLALMEGTQSRKTSTRANHGCAVLRLPAMRRLLGSSATSTFAGAHCRRIIPMRQNGIVAPPRQDTEPRPVPWDRFTSPALASRKMPGKRRVGSVQPPRRPGVAGGPRKSPAARTRWRGRPGAGGRMVRARGGDLIAAFNSRRCCGCAALPRGAGAQYMYGRMLAERRGIATDLAGARAWFPWTALLRSSAPSATAVK
jgi:TPR repeat protein